MTVKKLIKKILLYLIIAAFTILAGSIIATFLYRDQLIDHFIRQANKSINTPIHVDKVSVSSLDNFPKISLSFENIYIEESFAGSSYPLLQARKLNFTFNPIAIFNGSYIIEEVLIKDGKCHLKVDKSGKFNYDIFKVVDTTQQNAVKFSLTKVSLKDFIFTYTNDLKNVHLEVSSALTVANLAAVETSYIIESKGEVELKHLLANNQTWARDKKLDVNAKLKYDDQEKYLIIDPSVVGVKESKFSVHGNYAFKDLQQHIDLNVTGEKTDIQTLIAILPKDKTAQFQQYKSRGRVYFDLKLLGEISAKSSPSMNVNFGLENTELYHPDSKVTITHADMAGNFKAPDVANLSTATLHLKGISGQLENNRFTGSLYLENFKAPYIKCDFEGRVDINSLFKFYKDEAITSGTGSINANLNFEGNISDLENKSDSRKVKTSGDVNLNDLSLKLSQFPLALKNLQGNLLFNNNDLALSNVSGKLGNSDFLLNGFFKNIIAYLLFENQPVGIESRLKSEFIDLDQLLAANSSDRDNGKQYAFAISPRLVLNFDCDIHRLKFRRFKPTSIQGDLKVKNQVAQSDHISLEAMGGPISLTASIDARRKKLVKVNTNFNLQNINIDSLFYVFENFNQDFLVDRHLNGKIFADVDAEMIFNDKLHLFSETLTSNITTSIKNGELNNFEPMQQLAKYLDEKKLDHLRFSELKNNIHIENKTIYLPEMEVSSNVTDIRISGTHTFNQNIDYKIVAPLRSRQKIDKDEAFGAIEKDNAGRSMLYLKILGTTSDYRIMYDKTSVKKKVISDLKKEVDELKDAFKNKGVEESPTVELEEGEYFDWD